MPSFDPRDHSHWIALLWLPALVLQGVFKRSELSDREKMIKYLKKQARRETSRLPF